MEKTPKKGQKQAKPCGHLVCLQGAVLRASRPPLWNMKPS